MIHDPEVLILDEPTSGLDPNQLVEIRQLIKSFGAEKTVIFSTHIMQEVQAICDRVIIINRGQLVVDDPIEKLQQYVQQNQVIIVEFKEEIPKNFFHQFPGIKTVHPLPNKQWQIVSDQEKDLRPALFELAVKQQKTLVELHEASISVEDVFQKLTND